MTGGWQRSESLYRYNRAPCDVSTLPPPSAVPLPLTRGGKRLCGVRRVLLCLRRCSNLSAPLAKGVEVSGGHFGQIQGAIAHIDSSGTARRSRDWGVATYRAALLLRIRSSTFVFYRYNRAPCHVPTLPSFAPQMPPLRSTVPSPTAAPLRTTAPSQSMASTVVLAPSQGPAR